ncbi:MAG: hypothetical protein ACLRMZ_12085 [Blautia marasmi]
MYLMNSFVITAITILLVVIVSVLAGYGFSKLQLKGKDCLWPVSWRQL